MIYCVAIGNPLRGDDGVATRVIRNLGRGNELRKIEVLQLTPEIAWEIAGAEKVYLLDADINAAEPAIELVQTNSARPPALSHQLSPADVISLAERLFGFTGQAFLYRLPARNFNPGQQLSSVAENGARQAEDEIRKAIAAQGWSKFDHENTQVNLADRTLGLSKHHP